MVSISVFPFFSFTVSEAKTSFPMFLAACPPLLANCRSAVRILDSRRDEISDFVEGLMVAQNEQCLLCLVKLWIAVSLAVSRHHNEEEELQLKAQLIEKMILSVFKCRSMSNLSNVRKILLPKTSLRVLQGGQQGGALGHQHGGTGGQGLSGARMVRFFRPEQNIAYLTNGVMLDTDEVLGLCQANALKSIFGCSPVSNIIHDLFLGSIVVSTR